MLPGFTMFCLWLSFRNCHLLIESNLIQHKVRMLRKENRQLLREQIALEEGNTETKILCKEGSQKHPSSSHSSKDHSFIIGPDPQAAPNKYPDWP